MHILHTVPYKFPKVQQGEFVEQSRALLSIRLSNHFLYSYGINVWFGADLVTFDS